MFRVEAELELLTADKGILNAVPEISLRGYSQETPVAVTGQFIDKVPLSIGDITGFCPGHRDLYLRKILKTKAPDNSKNKSWARLAGPLIEEGLKYAYNSCKKKTKIASDRPADLREKADGLLHRFLKKKKIREQIKNLNKKVANRYDLREGDLKMLLFNTFVRDIFYLQGSLNYRRVNGGNRKALNNLELNNTYTPAEYMKISPNSAPDLILPKFNAIGDIKSGYFKDIYLLAVAGYALGYESVSKKDVNLGVLFLVETANDCIRSSRSLVFWITDELRERFLNRRDQALATLYQPESVPPALTNEDDINNYCSRCPFCEICHCGQV